MREKPALFAVVGPRNAVAIGFLRTKGWIESAIECRLDLFEIFWMRAFTKTLEGYRVVRTEAIDLARALRVEELSSFDVPIPDADLGRLGCQQEPAFGIDETEFSSLLLRNVPIDAHKLNRVSGGIRVR